MSQESVDQSLSPFFSVVIPTYNRSTKLARAVLSVLNQSFCDFEVLIVDDGSTDDTGLMVQALKDKRINYVWMENSGGPAAPRNVGLGLSEGEWVCFLDADDIWYPNKLKVIYDSIQSDSEVDILCNDEYEFNALTQKRTYLRAGPVCNDLYQRMLIEGNRLSSSATIVRKSVVKNYNIKFNESENYFAVEDYDFVLKLANIGCRFRFLPFPLGEYILDGDNISSEPIRNKLNLENLLREHVFKIQSFEVNKKRLWQRVRIRLCTYEAKVLFKNRRYLLGIFQLLARFICHPVDFIAYGIIYLHRKQYQRSCNFSI